MNTLSRIKIYKDTINIYTKQALPGPAGPPYLSTFPVPLVQAALKGLVLQPRDYDPLAALELVLLGDVDLDGIRRPFNPLSRTKVLNQLSLRSSASFVLG